MRMISPNPPGGANDTIGRIIAIKLGEVLGQPIVIDNRGGAGGTLGAEIAAQSNLDGYTLLAGSVSTHSFSPALKAKLNYDPVKDFTPISLFAISQNLLVTNPSLRVNTVGELVALAKSKEKSLNYASGGTGSTSHYAIALFVYRAGIDKETVHIPYKGGAPSVAATMSDVPTVAEAGIPTYQSFGWFGLLAPAKTPKTIIARLHAATVIAVSAPDIGQKFLQSEIPATGS